MVEKLLFYIPHKIKVSAPSTSYMKKLISTTTKYFMSASQSCEKLLRKCAKTCEKITKSRNTVAAYFTFSYDYDFANQIHCYKLLKCFVINLHKNTFNRSKT